LGGVLHVIAVPEHVPEPLQLSPVVQASPSLHAVPDDFGV